MGFVKEMNALASQFLWVENLSSLKWSLVKWEIVCSLKKFGGLGLRNSTLIGLALVENL